MFNLNSVGAEKSTKLISKIIIPALIFFISVEFILRFTGAYFNSERVAYLKIQADDISKLRILAIGESTTDEIMANNSGVRSWPKQLEELMNSSGIATRVYNVGVSGSNSYYLMKDLKENIEFFKPHIVVSMMGINDADRYGVYKSTFWDSIKLIKLVKIHKLFKERKSDRVLEPRTIDLKLLENLINKIKKENISSHEVVEIIENAKFGNKDKFLFFDELIRELGLRFQTKKGNIELISELIDEANKSNYYTDRFISSATFAFDELKKYDAGVVFALNVQQRLNYKFNVTSMNNILRCYENSSFKNSDDLKSFFLNQENSIELQKSGNATRDNYRYLFDTLRGRKIEFFAMQYPTQKIEWLKSLFSNDSEQDVHLISNEKIFIEELRIKKYEDLFIDNFAYEFGHATTLGNKIIARQAFDAIIDSSKSVAEYKKPKL